MDNTKKKNMLVGHAALLSANVMWGLMAPLGKDLLNSGVIPSMSLAALRIIAAALLFWSVSLLVPSDIVKKEKIDSKDWWKIIVASLLVIGANQVLIILGLAMANPVDAAIICSSTPILCVLVTAVLLHRWVGWLKSLGVATRTKASLEPIPKKPLEGCSRTVTSTSSLEHFSSANASSTAVSTSVPHFSETSILIFSSNSSITSYL